MFGVLAALMCGALVYAFVLPRPVNTTDPTIFLQDGNTVNYCDLPALDGSGKVANDIPKAYTPACGYKSFPMPILRVHRTALGGSRGHEGPLAWHLWSSWTS